MTSESQPSVPAVKGSDQNERRRWVDPFLLMLGLSDLLEGDDLS